MWCISKNYFQFGFPVTKTDNWHFVPFDPSAHELYKFPISPHSSFPATMFVIDIFSHSPRSPLSAAYSIIPRSPPRGTNSTIVIHTQITATYSNSQIRCYSMIFDKHTTRYCECARLIAGLVGPKPNIEWLFANLSAVCRRTLSRCYIYR